MPPTCGFFSKWYLAFGAVDAGLWIMVVVIMASSLLNAVYFFRVLENAYLRPAPEEEGDEELAVGSGGVATATRTEARPTMLLPTLAFAVGIVALGIFNTLIVTGILENIAPAGL
ncbi:MAG: hypothetical protein GWN32_11475 [Gemmatimonadetes bacterium]|nr:hypothetical protein [Gemmatimonadota bacterium]